MRLLCDQNVPRKYVTAFRQHDRLTATTVDEQLRHDAPDREIVARAERDGWVVFTNDEDFYVVGGDHGLLVYDQVTDPAPSAVVAAIERIDAAYESDAEILETVPGGWL